MPDAEPPLRTYSLQEVADILCGDDIEHRELWIKRRIKTGKFRALRVGRSYRMTTEQLRDAMAALEVGHQPPQPQPAVDPAIDPAVADIIAAMSPLSHRRRRRPTRRLGD